MSSFHFQIIALKNSHSEFLPSMSQCWPVFRRMTHLSLTVWRHVSCVPTTALAHSVKVSLYATVLKNKTTNKKKKRRNKHYGNTHDKQFLLVVSKLWTVEQFSVFRAGNRDECACSLKLWSGLASVQLVHSKPFFFRFCIINFFQSPCRSWCGIVSRSLTRLFFLFFFFWM